MNQTLNLQFRPFQPLDVDRLTPVMKRAFDEDSRRHTPNPTGGPPGYDNGDFLKRWALHRAATAFAVELDGRPVGGLILWLKPQGQGFLGNIFVDTDLQDQGVGLAMWQWVERSFPAIRTWKTETPAFSARNLHFYRDKCGFTVTGRDNQSDPPGGNLHFTKHLPVIQRLPNPEV